GFPAIIPVEWSVDVRPRVGEQLDLPDLEGRSGGVAGLGRIARQPVADYGGGETGVGDHPVLDLMAQVDEPMRRHGSLSPTSSTAVATVVALAPAPPRSPSPGLRRRDRTRRTVGR